MPTIPLRERPAWKALETHHAEIGGRHLRDLFADDPDRGERLCAEAAGLSLRRGQNLLRRAEARLAQLYRSREALLRGAQPSQGNGGDVS